VVIATYKLLDVENLQYVANFRNKTLLNSCPYFSQLSTNFKNYSFTGRFRRIFATEFSSESHRILNASRDLLTHRVAYINNYKSIMTVFMGAVFTREFTRFME